MLLDLWCPPRGLGAFPEHDVYQVDDPGPPADVGPQPLQQLVDGDLPDRTTSGLAREPLAALKNGAGPLVPALQDALSDTAGQ